jgi:hypothetical protein
MRDEDAPRTCRRARILRHQTSGAARRRTVMGDLSAVIASAKRAAGRNAETARADAAAQVDRLRELIASVDRSRPARSVAPVDFARIADALRALAEHLRAPTLAGEAGAATAIAELQAAMGPLAPREPPRDIAAIREHHRQRARSAMTDHFRRNPHRPFKP